MTEVRDDDDVRRRAVQPDLSVLLEAPAGSGKTSVLTERLLALLTIVDEPEEVLAVTFTRKAAAEMRARVLEALAGRLEAGRPHLQRLRDLAAKVRERSAARGWNLEDHPASLRIQTLDALNVSIAAQAPMAAGVLTPVIADRPEDLYARAARRALIDASGHEALRADVDLLFSRLDNRWSQVETLLAAMLEQRAHWLTHLMVDEVLDLRTRVGGAVAHFVRSQLERNVSVLGRNWLDAAQDLPGCGPLTGEPSSLGSWTWLAGVALTKEGTLRKQVGASLPEALRSEPAKGRFKALLAGIEGDDAALECLVRTRALPPLEFDDADGAALDALARLLPWATGVLYAEFTEAGRVDHTYMAGAARAALTQEGEATDLALRFGARLRHILIDEFQDTSLAQFDLLTGLVRDWSDGDGRTLFIVGDPMQSIYQFREAEVGLFLRVRKSGLGPVRLENLRLTRNFRARPALVRWSNDLFAKVFPPRDDVGLGAISHAPSLAAREEAAGHPITLQLIADGTRDAEAAATVEQIVGIRQRDPHGSVAVLVPARRHAIPITQRLMQAGLPVRGIDLVPLEQVPAVRDVVSLARALDHAGDRTAWLAVLRAPWCGLRLASLQALSGRHDAMLVPEALADEARLSRLDGGERSRAERVRDILLEAMEARDRLPPHELIEGCWLRLGGQDTCDEAGLEAVRIVFEAIGSSIAAREWRDAGSLASILSSLFAAPDPMAHREGAIEVMTVHGAKGLEFDHVVLPGLGSTPRHEGKSLLRWLDLPREEGGSDLLMAPIASEDEGAEDRLGEFISGLAADRREQERRRLLYVAVTRARESLHVIASIKRNKSGDPKPRKHSLLEVAWSALADDFTVLDPPVGTNANPPDLSIRRLPIAWSLPSSALQGRDAGGDLVVANPSVEFSWVGEAARHVGTVTHRALQAWGTRGGLPDRQALEGSRESLRRQLVRRGIAGDELGAAVEAVIEALGRVQEDERGRWLFDATHRDAANELALSGFDSGRIVHAIIDRTFVDTSGTRWVIDYKTSRHAGGRVEDFLDTEMERYRPQLERYARLAATLGPEPVRVALYFPLLGAFRILDEPRSAQ